MSRVWLVYIAAVLLTFIVLERVGYLTEGWPGTLSANVRAWSAIHPLVPFVIGCAVGALALHFWSAAVTPH